MPARVEVLSRSLVSSKDRLIQVEHPIRDPGGWSRWGPTISREAGFVKLLMAEQQRHVSCVRDGSYLTHVQSESELASPYSSIL
jgi:hypothetical protein